MRPLRASAGGGAAAPAAAGEVTGTWRSLLGCWLLLLVAVAGAAPIGLNLPALDVEGATYGGVWASASTSVWVDLFKHSTPFVGQGRGRGSSGDWGYAPQSAFTFRPDGYPTTLEPAGKPANTEYSVVAKVGVPRPYYAAGPYSLLYDGAGTVTVTGDASVTLSRPGLLQLAVTPSAGFYVRISNTSAANPVRNIRVVPAAAKPAGTTGYLKQPFTAKFLSLVKGFSVLRFSAWQKVAGDERSPATAPRDWGARPTPASQTQNGPGGVAVEHMVALANAAGAGMWLSLPAAANESDSYSLGLASYVLANLKAPASVYIEFGDGAPGWMTRTLADNTIRLAKVWRSVWTGPNAKRLVVTANYANPAWIPYFESTFGAALGPSAGQSGTAFVDAITTLGSYGSVRTWNAPYYCHYEFNSASFLARAENFNMTYGDVMGRARSSVIHADVTNTKWRGVVTGRLGKDYLGMAGGPDAQMEAPYYASRMNYGSAMGCTSFPCTRTIFPPASPSGSITFASAAERDAAAAGYKPMADAELALEEKLQQIKLREPATRDHFLDSLWRWDTMNGSLLVVALPAHRKCSDAPGSGLFPPLECVPGSGVATVASPEASPAYLAVRDYLARKAGALPLAGAAPPPPPACSPVCKFGTCVKGTCRCWAGFAGPDCSANSTAPRPNACNDVMGVNLEGVADYAHSWTFTDIMKSGRTWLLQNSEGGGGWGNTNVSTDSGGWVRRLNNYETAGTILIRDLQGHAPAGVYTVLWQGDGLLDFGFDVTEARQLGAGRAEVTVRPSTGGNNGLYVIVVRTNASNPIRNIRVLMPGVDPDADSAIPFHPLLLSFLAPFGAIRFMDWMQANADATQLPALWSQRPKTTDRSFGANKGGVPVEHMVLLANLVGAAPWFSMPFTADDAFHRSFAQYVKANLRPDVRVYVEWANEVWHTGFPAGQFAQSEGVRLGMNEEGDRWPGGKTNEARLCYYAERTKNMSRVWKAAFGAGAARVVVVAQGQAVWPITSDKVLSCRNATPYIDALAVAPYFGSFQASRDTTLEYLMNVTMAKEVNNSLGYAAPHAAAAERFGKPLLAYEAGQGLAADHPLPIQANRDGGMYGLYARYLSGLRALGTKLVMHYSSISAYSKYGSWGLMEWADQDPATAPKLQAVRAFIDGVCAERNASSGGNGDAGCPGGCSGRGACVAGACSCYAGFLGPSCNSTVYTDYSTCGYYCTFYQGSCEVARVEGLSRYLACNCSAGFSGYECSIFTCPNNCSWQGACIDKGVCSCYPGFSGAACEVDCGCNGHGMCSNGASAPCICDAGFKLGPGGCEPECSAGCAGSSGGGALPACAAPGECGCEPACKWGTCYNGRCHCWAGVNGTACDSLSGNSPNRGSPVGLNLAGLSYWTTQWVFTDVMRHSSKWWTQNAPDTSLTGNAFDVGYPLDLRPDGYPASLPADKIAHKLTTRDVLLHAMPGRYVALFDGEGTLDFGFDAKVASRANGRVEFDFTPTADLACAATGAAYCGDNGIWIALRATNPADPIRNLRVYPPGLDSLDGRQVFHPWFLKFLERFSVLRFMDWMDTNSADNPGRWAARATPAADTQAGKPGGVALELVARLCNELGAAPWLNVPHLADDDYVRALAQFFKDNLRPDLKVYVEHSNEVWNEAFPQGKYAQQRGLELGLAADKYTAAYLYHGKRSEEIFDIWTEVWGADARRSRLVFVVGTWGFVCNLGGCGPPAAAATLSYGSVASKADVLAVAAYFDCGLGSAPVSEALMSLDDMLAKCYADLNATRASLLTMKAVAAAHNLTLGTYEGGPSIVEGSVIFNGGGTPGAAEKYIALQRDARFEGVYSSYLAMFEEIGLVGSPIGGAPNGSAGAAAGSVPFMHFSSVGTPSKYGSWGLLEYTGQDPATAPKYRAVTDLLDRRAPLGPLCMDPERGYLGLPDSTFRGPPAVMRPAKGDVWVQGVQYNLTVPLAHAPLEPITVAWFRGSDCGSAPPLFTTSAAAFAAAPPFTAFLTLTVPDAGSILGGDVFLRVEGAASGRRNYSDVFTVQKQAVQADGGGGCVWNPRLPPTQPPAQGPPHCRPELQWNLTALPTGWCGFEPNGCRYYRTARAGWWSSFKPVYDCTALYSPNPSRAALAAAGAAVLGPVPGSPSGQC